jgi:hypothetical protein
VYRYCFRDEERRIERDRETERERERKKQREREGEERVDKQTFDKAPHQALHSMHRNKEIFHV